MVKNTEPAELQAVRQLERLALSAGVAAAIQAAVKLGLPEAVGDEPVHTTELATAVGVDTHTLPRLLRALASQGVFEEAAPDRYGHTSLSRLLRKDAPRSLRHLALWVGAPWTWEAWPRLEDAGRTGKSVIPSIYGKEFYAYLREDAAADAANFNRAMTEVSSFNSDTVAEVLDLDGVSTVADIAGGQGRLLRTLLERHPKVNGVLFDLEAAILTADPELREGALATRTKLVAGDCLREIPVKADLYILKNLLDWPDDNSLMTLHNILAYAEPGARVVVVDSLVDADPDEMQVTTIVDLFLLLNVGGQKHTQREFEELYTRAGLRFTGVQPVSGTFPTLQLIEGTVVSGG